jgi:hypothetical protein
MYGTTLMAALSTSAIGGKVCRRMTQNGRQARAYRRRDLFSRGADAEYPIRLRPESALGT